VEFHLLIEIEPTRDLGSVYPVAYTFLTKDLAEFRVKTNLIQHTISAVALVWVLLWSTIIRVSGPSDEEGAMAPILFYSVLLHCTAVTVNNPNMSEVQPKCRNIKQSKL
jgi:hypothetical protein